MRTRKLRDGCANPSIQLCLFLFEPWFPSIFFYLCHQTSSLLFLPQILCGICRWPLKGKRSVTRSTAVHPPPWSPTAASGVAWGCSAGSLPSAGREKTPLKRGRSSHRVRRPPHQHPPPLAQQMTSVETAELTHIDCLLQMVFWVLQ